MKSCELISKNIKDVIEFINEYSTNQEEKNKMIDKKLLDILKDCYLQIRTVKTEALEIINVLDMFITYVLNEKNICGAALARVGSFISLKNDTQLQYELKKEYVDVYLKEVKKLIDKNKYKNQCSTISKVLEIIAKIQFAYNILDIKNTEVLDIYKKLILEMMDVSELKYYFDLPTYPEHHTLATLFSYYLLFNKDKTMGYGYEISLQQILFEWKYFKFKHYNMSKEKIDQELINDSEYNFIYNEGS